MAAVSLCCRQASTGCSGRVCFLGVVCGPLTAASCCAAQAVGAQSPNTCALQAVECSLSSCSSWAQMLSACRLLLDQRPSQCSYFQLSCPTYSHLVRYLIFFIANTFQNFVRTTLQVPGIQLSLFRSVFTFFFPCSQKCVNIVCCCLIFILFFLVGSCIFISLLSF